MASIGVGTEIYLKKIDQMKNLLFGLDDGCDQSTWTRNWFQKLQLH